MTLKYTPFLESEEGDSPNLFFFRCHSFPSFQDPSLLLLPPLYLQIKKEFFLQVYTSRQNLCDSTLARITVPGRAGRAGRASELSSRCLCLSLDILGLLLCGGGSGLDAVGAARPPPAPPMPPLRPSVNPPTASGHMSLSPCVSCWCHSVTSVAFRASVSCFGDGVLSDG